jgi:hypothetical protein
MVHRPMKRTPRLGTGRSASTQKTSEYTMINVEMMKIESAKNLSLGIRVSILGCVLTLLVSGCSADKTTVPTDDLPPSTDTPSPSDQWVDCKQTLEPPVDGACSITTGSEVLRIRGNVVTPDGVLAGGEAVILNGLIACVACDCSADYADATVLTCPDVLVTPGLINPHDHLTFAQHPPVDPGDERYEHRHDWRKGKGGHTKLSVPQNFFGQGELWGEIRMVMGGATSIMGSGGEEGFLRNLDRSNLLEGLSHAIPDAPTFPLGDSDGKYYDSGCAGYKKTPNPDTLAGKVAYVPHVAEGINDFARNEFLCLSGTVAGSVDLLMGTSAFIHAIGLSTADASLMATEGTGLIWSPRSNVALYGFTAQARMYDSLGVRIALGTDWSASGSMNVLRELQCADSLNQNHMDGYFSDRDLLNMATQTAAELSGFGDVVGSIQEGRWADISLFDGRQNEGYRALIDANVTDVILVLRGGVVQYGDQALVEALALSDGCDVLDVCGRSKGLCTQRETGMNLAAIEAGVANAGGQSYTTYPLFFCDVPDNEPSCVPYRSGEFSGVASADDPDGDGIASDKDNCPHVFNPPRPMDGGNQPNGDGDDLGDACDPCPFDTDTTDCSGVDPDDLDGDGISNVMDNCPSTQNTDQANADGDARGDACDDCPEEVDPCLSTVYEIREGIVLEGAAVSLPPLMVTATSEVGFYVQHSPSEEGYPGAKLSGIYVYDPNGMVSPKRGDQVVLNGTVDLFYDKWEVIKPTGAVVETTLTMPEPVVVSDPTTIATGGADAANYEGVLVQVENVTVLDASPLTDETAPTNEFLVTGNLLVNDGFYWIEPTPQVGLQFERITGVLNYGWSNSKLEPRDANDVATGAPILQALGPDLVYIHVGESGSTQPPLMVSLSSVTDAPVSVALTSDNPLIAKPVQDVVVISAGEQHVEVAVEALAASLDPITITATYLDGIQTAAVRVIGLEEANGVISLEPTELTMVSGASESLQLDLKFPASAEGEVVHVSTEPEGLVEAPASLVVSAGQISATFDVTALSITGDVNVHVGLQPGVAEASVTIHLTEKPTVGLVLVEVFYDPPSSDDGLEWVKLYNGTTTSISLDAYSLGWGGADYTNGKVNLSGSVPAGGCFIVGGPFTTEVNGSPVFDQSYNFNPDIQNSGSTADGVALFSLTSANVTSTTVPIDAVLYGDINKNGLLNPSGVPGEVDVAKAPSGHSLLRTSLESWLHHATPHSIDCPAL